MVVAIAEFILLLVAHSVVGIYSSFLKYSKKITYFIWGAWILLQCVILYYSEFILNNIALKFFCGFILPLIGQYTIFFLTTKGRLLMRVFTILTYSIFFCISMTFFTTIKGSLGDAHSIFTAIIQTVLLLAVVVYFLRSVCPLCRVAAKNITTGWMPLIFVNIIFMITVILSSIFPVKLTDFEDPAFITFIFLSVAIMSVYPIIFSSINNLSEASTKREVERQNKLLLAQIEVENAQRLADSHARHDRRHHNLVMLEFVNNNDIESVREYLKNLVESDVQVSGEVRFCDNMTVSTVLSVYQKRAKELGISVKITANVSRDVSVLPQDLVIIIANLFENAINATEKFKNNKHIDIIIKDTAKRLLIKVDNPCKSNLTFDETLYGVGIRSVIATANKYEGLYDFTAEDGMFSAKISLNLM